MGICLIKKAWCCFSKVSSISLDKKNFFYIFFSLNLGKLSEDLSPGVATVIWAPRKGGKGFIIKEKEIDVNFETG